MVKVKLIFLLIMAVLACVIFFSPMFFREKKGGNEDAGRRTRVLVRIRMGCFLGILILMLLCVIL